MAEYSGSALYFGWIYSGGTVVLSGDQRSVGFTPSVEFADTTAGSDARKGRLVTVKDAAVSYAGVAQSAGTALEDALVEGTQGTIILGPEGTAAGHRKYTIGAFSQGAKFNYPYSGVVEITCDFIGDGNLTRGSY